MSAFRRAQKEKAEAERLKKEADKLAADEAAAAAAAAKAEADRKRAADQAAREEKKKEQKAAEALRKAEEKQRRLDRQAAEEQRRKQDLEKQRIKAAEEKAAKEKKSAEAASKKEAARLAKEAAEKEKREKQAADRKTAAEDAARQQREDQARTRAAAQQAKHGSANKPPPLQPTSILQSPNSVNKPPVGNNAVRGPSAAGPRTGGPTPIGLPPSTMPGIPRGAPTPIGAPAAAQAGSMAQQVPFRPQTQQQQQPFSSNAAVSPFARAPSTQGIAMPMPMASTSESPTHSRPASVVATGLPGMSFPQQQQQPAFGPVGMGPQSPLRTIPAAGQITPANSNSSANMFVPTPVGHQVNGGVASGYRHASTPALGPIGSAANSSYGNIGLGTAQSMQKVPSGEQLQARRPSAIAGAIGAGRQEQQQHPQPIGRPQRQGAKPRTSGVDEDDMTRNAASLRSPTPPVFTGSSALLDDDDALPDGDPALASAIGSHAYADPSIWGGSGGMWAMNQKQTRQPDQPSSEVDARKVILRARIVNVCSHMAAERGMALSNMVYHDWLAVVARLTHEYPDSSSADGAELLNSIELTGDQLNGGGRFDVRSEGPNNVLLGFMYPSD